MVSLWKRTSREDFPWRVSPTACGVWRGQGNWARMALGLGGVRAFGVVHVGPSLFDQWLPGFGELHVLHFIPYKRVDLYLLLKTRLCLTRNESFEHFQLMPLGRQKVH